MSDREMVSVRLASDTRRRIKKYAEKHDVNQSTAIRRLLHKGSDIEKAGIAVAASTLDDESDDELISDGSGRVVRPMLNFLAAIYGGVILLVFGVLMFGAYNSILWIPYGELLPLLFSTAIFVALITVILYTSLPERADLLIQDKVVYPINRRVVNPARQKYHQVRQ